MGFNRFKILFPIFILLYCNLLYDGVVFAANTTTQSSQIIKDPQTLSSNDGNFTLGFINPQNSTNRYVAIWCKSPHTVVWVANRNQPLKDSSGVVTTSDDGNLVVLNGQKQVIWSSNVSNIVSNSSFQVSSYGSLLLVDTTGNTIWESFNHPSNTLLPHMKLTNNKITGEKVEVTSWKSLSDPAIGSFSCSVERLKIPEVFVWNESQPYWRSGPWNGQVFTGILDMGIHYLNGFRVEDDVDGTVDISFAVDDFGIFIYILNSQGQLIETSWDDEKEEWQVTWTSQESECDVYGKCGAFAICNSQGSPICTCLKGFEPRNNQEWNRQNWSSGCVRRTHLQCERVNNQNTSENSNKADGFVKLEMVKVPDLAEWSSVTQDICRSQCLENCSCIAYSYNDAIGCMAWNVNLVDIQQFPRGGTDLYIRVPYAELDKGHNITRIIIIVTVMIGIFIIVTGVYVIWRRAFYSARKKKNYRFFRLNKGQTSEEDTNGNIVGELSPAKLQELLLFNFEKVATATNNFHPSNKLGQGGFGPVYKGELQDGREIAVKRLTRESGQGLEEFMNEVVVLSKLQHRNLVKLLGCCIEGDEKMLIYEHMPNKSLDAHVFGPSKNKLLDWKKRFSIIEGIARGLLYLHRDSRIKIIHRDLKASNILLDEELNPKVSDFGMAKIFGGSEDQANTQRVVGTYGYMSPEYAMQGVFSEKSDVFSFGVLLLEIASGRRNSSFHDSENSLTLLGFAWIQWKEGNISSLIDPEIYDHSFHKNILRCIHIGLLCVQESAADRPTMAAVISMLNSEIMDLPPVREPAFILRQNMLNSISSEESIKLYSLNTIPPGLKRLMLLELCMDVLFIIKEYSTKHRAQRDNFNDSDLCNKGFREVLKSYMIYMVGWQDKNTLQPFRIQIVLHHGNIRQPQILHENYGTIFPTDQESFELPIQKDVFMYQFRLSLVQKLARDRDATAILTSMLNSDFVNLPLPSNALVEKQTIFFALLTQEVRRFCSINYEFLYKLAIQLLKIKW